MGVVVLTKKGAKLGSLGEKPTNGSVSGTLKCCGEGYVMASYEIVDPKLCERKRAIFCTERN